MTQSTFETSQFQDFLKGLAFIFGVASLLLFVLSADMFDTVGNLFRRGTEDFPIRSHLVLKKYFYLKGAKLYYPGYACFLVFVLLSFSYFYPLSSGFGVGL